MQGGKNYKRLVSRKITLYTFIRVINSLKIKTGGTKIRKHL